MIISGLRARLLSTKVTAPFRMRLLSEKEDSGGESLDPKGSAGQKYEKYGSRFGSQTFDCEHESSRRVFQQSRVKPKAQPGAGIFFRCIERFKCAARSADEIPLPLSATVTRTPSFPSDQLMSRKRPEPEARRFPPLRPRHSPQGSPATAAALRNNLQSENGFGNVAARERLGRRACAHKLRISSMMAAGSKRLRELASRTKPKVCCAICATRDSLRARPW